MVDAEIGDNIASGALFPQSASLHKPNNYLNNYTWNRTLAVFYETLGAEETLELSLSKYARAAGVRQVIEFPRLEGSFSGGQPLFVPTGGQPK